jgi:alanine racemase
LTTRRQAGETRLTLAAGRKIDDSPPARELFGPLAEVDMRASVRPTVAEVDLGAIVRNADRLAAMVGGAEIWGVIKADAYGHGAVPVARALAGRCPALAVSLVEEALELRAAGIATPIVVLSAYYDHCHGQVLDERLTPVVYDPADLEAFSRAAAERRRSAALHLKIETGMNRLGIAPGRLPAVLDRLAELPGLRLAGLSTHLASADAADGAATTAALSIFAGALKVASSRGLSGLTNHAANSAAAVRFPEARFQAVRPGLALYGAMPSDVVRLPALEPALRLITRVMAIHPVDAGAPVSYGGEWRASRPSLIATLPVGYADGYPRHVRRAQVLLRGKRVDIVGVVCMDMMMVDVTDVAGAAVGDLITLLGTDPEGASAPTATISADELAAWAGTIYYEILSGISKRVPRVYKS